MTTASIPQESLSPCEWDAQYGAELDRLYNHWRAAGLSTVEIEQRCAAYRAAHPPQFEGIYTTPNILANQLPSVPPLIPGNPLWIDAWFGEPPRQVREVIPIVQHSLVILVTDVDVTVLRRVEFDQAAPAAWAHGGTQ